LINNIWCVEISRWCNDFSSDLTSIWISISIVTLVGVCNWLLGIVSSVNLSFISLSLSSVECNLRWLSSH
jgi:hypothetical protein